MYPKSIILFCLMFLLDYASSFLVERRLSGDIIYGLDQYSCIADFDNTEWAYSIIAPHQGYCECINSFSTFIIDGCYSSMDAAKGCSMHVTQPFIHIPVMEKLTHDRREYFQIGFQEIYGLSKYARFSSCEAAVHVMNIDNGQWEILESVISIKPGSTVVVIPTDINIYIEGYLVKLTFTCNNVNVGCIVLKAEGTVEISADIDNAEFANTSNSEDKTTEYFTNEAITKENRDIFHHKQDVIPSNHLSNKKTTSKPKPSHKPKEIIPKEDEASVNRKDGIMWGNIEYDIRDEVKTDSLYTRNEMKRNNADDKYIGNAANQKSDNKELVNVNNIINFREHPENKNKMNHQVKTTFHAQKMKQKFVNKIKSSEISFVMTTGVSPFKIFTPKNDNKMKFLDSSIQTKSTDTTIQSTSKPKGISTTATIAYCILSGLVVALGCLLCVVADRVYKIHQNDQLYQYQDLITPAYIKKCSKDNEAVDENDEDLFKSKKLPHGSNMFIPKIYVEQPDDERLEIFDPNTPLEHDFNGNCDGQRICSVRLTRDVSSKAKPSLKRRISLLDGLFKEEKLGNEKKLANTPPLYRKTSLKRK